MPAVKLAVASDLYLPVTAPDKISALARDVAAFGPDAVVLAGNLAESLADLTRCLKLWTEQLACPVWVLPGDHEFWARPPHDSRQLWREVVPQAVEKAGCFWLEGTAFQLRDKAVAGTVAWYDYSAADPSLELSNPAYAQRKYEYNADALRIDWEWSDPEFAGLVGATFLATLDQLETNLSVRQTIVVTHFPILPEQLPPPDPDPGLLFARAYLGNLKLGHQVLARTKVSHVLSGHTRHGMQSTVGREKGAPVSVQVVDSTYEKPGWVGLTLG